MFTLANDNRHRQKQTKYYFPANMPCPVGVYVCVCLWLYWLACIRTCKTCLNSFGRVVLCCVLPLSVNQHYTTYAGCKIGGLHIGDCSVNVGKTTYSWNGQSGGYLIECVPICARTKKTDSVKKWSLATDANCGFGEKQTAEDLIECRGLLEFSVTYECWIRGFKTSRVTDLKKLTAGNWKKMFKTITILLLRSKWCNNSCLLRFY